MIETIQAATAPATYCEECHVHEALPSRIQIIVDSVLKAVRYCAVCQEKYFEKLPLNRAQRRATRQQLRLSMKHEARHDKAKVLRQAKRAA